MDLDWCASMRASETGNVGEVGAGALGGYEEGVVDRPHEMGY